MNLINRIYYLCEKGTTYLFVVWNYEIIFYEFQNIINKYKKSLKMIKTLQTVINVIGQNSIQTL
jgi:hypothetical protein